MSLKIGVIVGSTRPNRVGRNVAEWFMSEVEHREDVEFELIDLAEENLPFLNEPKSPMMGDYAQESTKRWSEKISEYDGYVWVTSEYNHGYPAPLKNAIDTLYHEWARKPVAFVGYGGMGGARAIEQLGAVAAQINAVPLTGTSTSVRIIDVWSALDERGRVKPEFVRGSTKDLGDHLVWWAGILKEARAGELITA